jgi:hypothetical protein
MHGALMQVKKIITPIPAKELTVWIGGVWGM